MAAMAQDTDVEAAIRNGDATILQVFGHNIAAIGKFFRADRA